MFSGKNSYKGRNMALIVVIITTAALIMGGCGTYKALKIDNSSEKTIVESSTKEIAGKEDLIPVYGYDKDSINKEINFYISVQKDLTLEEKLKVIAERLSRFRFNDLPIEVVRVKVDEGKKIAVINLGETEENKGVIDPSKIQGDASDTWIFGYFQGSAGGSATTETLLETFLQKEYEGDWIDGIEFLYENGPISMMHVEGLIGRAYR